MNIGGVRVADESEAAAIAALVNEAYRPAIGLAGWTHESELVAGERIAATQVVAAMRRPNSVILVGESGSEIVCCAHVEKEDQAAHIGMLAVRPAMQAAGIGKWMLACAERHAAEVFGVACWVLVVVSARRELIDFYLRRGYRRVGPQMDYPLAAGAGVPKDPSLKIERLEKWCREMPMAPPACPTEGSL